MTAYWQPSAANYLGRVSKEHILEAVREGASENQLKATATFKKPAMAEAAEKALAGKGRLPPLLRMPSQTKARHLRAGAAVAAPAFLIWHPPRQTNASLRLPNRSKLGGFDG